MDLSPHEHFLLTSKRHSNRRGILSPHWINKNLVVEQYTGNRLKCIASDFIRSPNKLSRTIRIHIL